MSKIPRGIQAAIRLPADVRRERVSSPHREHRNVDDEQYMREDMIYKLYDNAQMGRILMGRVFPHHHVQATTRPWFQLKVFSKVPTSDAASPVYQCTKIEPKKHGIQMKY